MRNLRLRRLLHRAEHGFTVVEMVVTLGILVVVMVGVLELFDLASHVARVQTEIADTQQSLRSVQYDMVRLLRMAGRGNLPTEVTQPAPPAAPPPFSLPQGLAIGVSDNVGSTTYVDDPGRAHKVLEGTDVLTIRGVLTSPVYTVLQSTFNVDASVGSPTFGQGSLVLSEQARPGVPVPQDLKPLADAIKARRPEAIILVSPLDDGIYEVVELDPARSAVDDFDHPTSVTLAFRFSGGTNTGTYLQLAGGTWDGRMTDAAYAGILEEYRFYIADTQEVDPARQPQTMPKPKLMRAQVYPGTQTPWNGNAANWAVTEADNVNDLQVALGIAPSTLTEPTEGTDAATRAADLWLYNSPGDDVTATHWRFDRLMYVRLTTTAFTDRRDLKYLAPATVTSENHSYTIPDPGASAGAPTPDRSFRRRTLQTVVDLRNVT
jgi:type II secretory pathway pseudopilin PulG